MEVMWFRPLTAVFLATVAAATVLACGSRARPQEIETGSQHLSS